MPACCILQSASPHSMLGATFSSKHSWVPVSEQGCDKITEKGDYKECLNLTLKFLLPKWDSNKEGFFFFKQILKQDPGPWVKSSSQHNLTCPYFPIISILAPVTLKNTPIMQRLVISKSSLTAQNSSWNKESNTVTLALTRNKRHAASLRLRKANDVPT